MVIADDISSAISLLGLETRSDRHARNSLLAFREKFLSSRPPLRLQISGATTVTVSEVVSLTSALQDATARMALLILHPNEDRPRISQAIRDRSNLIARSQIGNTIYFDFPTPVATEGAALPLGKIEHLAERAMRDFIQVLPADNDDMRTIEALPSRREGTRSAVAEFAKAVEETGTVTLALSSGNDPDETSVLTREQAHQVPDLLSSTRSEVEELVIVGELDGWRTRRLLFFINEDEDKGGREYQGSVERDQLPILQQAMGQRVSARVRRTIFVHGDGSRSRASYSLIALDVAPEIGRD